EYHARAVRAWRRLLRTPAPTMWANADSGPYGVMVSEATWTTLIRIFWILAPTVPLSTQHWKLKLLAYCTDRSNASGRLAPGASVTKSSSNWSGLPFPATRSQWTRASAVPVLSTHALAVATKGTPAGTLIPAMTVAFPAGMSTEPGKSPW